MKNPLWLLVVLAGAGFSGQVQADEYRRTADIAIGGGDAWGLAFMPDGKHVVVGGWRKQAGEVVGTVQVWAVASNDQVKQFKGHTNAVWAVAVSPDGKMIASGSMDKTARVWDYQSGNELAKLDQFDDRVTSVAFSPDNKTLLAGSNDGSAVLYDIAAKKVTFPLNGHKAEVRGVAFAPNGKICATVGKDNAVLIWNTGTGKLVRGMKFPDIFYSVTFTPDSNKLIFAGGREFKGDHSIKMVDLTQQKGKAQMFKGHSDSVWGLSLTKDGKTLASCGYHDETVRVWDVGTQTSKAVIKLGTDAHAVAISPDGQWLAGATRRGFMLWEKVGK